MARSEDISAEYKSNTVLPAAAEKDPITEATVIRTESAETSRSPKKSQRTKPTGLGQKALEERLRQEVGGFEFGALLSGVSTISQPGISPPKKTESRLPGPSAKPIETVNPAPATGLLSRPPLHSASPGSVLAAPAATSSGISGGPLDSARAFTEHAIAKGGAGKAAANPTAGWTYKTRRTYDFGSIIAIVIIIAALCVGTALAINYFAKPAGAPAKPTISTPKASPPAKKPVHRAHRKKNG